MRLKCLDIQGFKSFPDKINIGFDRGITAIVGPNGSGKSNVSDAIRWVLGEQSNKSLRSTKMEDVIFSGTSNRKPQGFAEVSLTIDNGDHALNLDYNEVMITRRYYRSGESEYFINKAPARLRDINELFMDTGIGRDGYSIIGQGTIDQILLGKSEERRSMLEEVAGISKFRYRKNEAQRKLEATEENLIRLGDIVNELRERLPNLEHQAEKAHRYLAMYEEKKGLEIALWLEELDQIKENASKIEEHYSIAKGQLEDLSVEIENIEQEISNLFNENITINTQIDRIRQQQTAWEEQLGALSSQQAVLKSQAEFEKGVIARLEQDLNAALGRREDLEQNMQQLSGDISGRQEEIGRIEEKIRIVFGEIEAITAKGEDQRRKAGDFQAALEENSRRRTRLQMEMISADSVAQTQTGRLEELLQAREEQGAQTRQLEEELAAIRSRLETKTQELESERNASAGLRKMLEIRERTWKEALEAEQRCESQRGALEQRARILSEMEKHHEGFGGAVKLVLEQSSRGILTGIIGPVSKLIRVDKQYLTAIETALGAAIQNIVTTDSKAAKNAMLLLKNRSAGRATFLPLKSLTPKKITEDFSGRPGFIGIADQLVDTEEENRKAIAFLLGRTLVCDTIDHALSLAKESANRFRVVTLDGQVINAGGSMTGGSAARSAGLLSRGLELEKISEELQAKTKEHEALAAQLERAAHEKGNLEARFTASEEAAQLLEEEQTRLTGLLENKEVVNASYQALSASLEREEQAVRSVLSEAEGQAKERREQMEALEAEAAALQKELTSLQGLDSGDQARLEQLKQQASALELDKMSFFKEIEGIQTLIGQLEAQLGLLGQEESEKNTQIEESKKKIDAAHAGAAEIEAQADVLRGKQEESALKTKALAQTRQDQEHRQTLYRAEQKEKSAAKDRLIEEVSRLEHKLSGIADQSDRLIAQLLDVYELTVSEAKNLVIPLEDRAEARRRVHALKGSIKALGSVNLESIEEYNNVKERFDFMDGQVQDLVRSRSELEKIIRELLSQMKEIFSEKFLELNNEFQRVFSELFGGGTAKLILSDPEDVLNCDIDVKAAPPGKIIKNLVSLSGGERAFTAICLYFAILKVRPTPFCIVDEIEAALDDVNVTRFANYLRRYCDTTQFICITHRRGTMEEADVLYGVTMPEQGISKLLTINVKEMAEQLNL